MDEHKSKVYVQIDTQGRVVRIDGGYTMENIQRVSEWILLDEGYGDKYNLCQSNYLEKPLMDEHGVYRYKLVEDTVVERTTAELDADYLSTTSSVDEAALLRAKVQALSERGEFLEECIAEMAMLVYGDA